MKWRFENGKFEEKVTDRDIPQVLFAVEQGKNGKIGLYFHGLKKRGTPKHMIVRTPLGLITEQGFAEVLRALTGERLEPSDLKELDCNDLRDALIGTQVQSDICIPDRSRGDRGVILIFGFAVRSGDPRIKPHDNVAYPIVPRPMLPDFEFDAPAKPKGLAKVLTEKRKSAAEATERAIDALVHKN